MSNMKQPNNTVIHKYEIVGPELLVNLPRGTIFLCAGFQEIRSAEVVCIWLEKPIIERIVKPECFKVFGTGQTVEYNVNGLHYLASAQESPMAFVWHVYGTLNSSNNY